MNTVWQESPLQVRISWLHNPCDQGATSSTNPLCPTSMKYLYFSRPSFDMSKASKPFGQAGQLLQMQQIQLGLPWLPQHHWLLTESTSHLASQPKDFARINLIFWDASFSTIPDMDDRSFFKLSLIEDGKSGWEKDGQNPSELEADRGLKLGTVMDSPRSGRRFVPRARLSNSSMRLVDIG
ncbi:hypothetical protein TWF192_001814 [Orbilia oligospora]|uniref:Uncharacterized protein n=1 Tax=Orbilia oligospora TaxID=2813651 RepID=A0A6G1MEY0_ORBOL|nr:hypothetical protein TWF191_000648 [Orbilia oligospora]KAF3214091.1 hypothetical protein TWF679_004961 [Orbilia oligospora]KAF3256389.1 hypothetical protein TWF192_001814 [Orbilia oligospora]